MSIFRDFKNFFFYKKVIKKNRVNLESKFNIRIDGADRMYTVLNIPTNLVEEPYNLRKSDVDIIAQKYISDFVAELSTYLNSIELSELYGFYEPIKKVDKYSYLVIIGYNQLDSVEINKIFYRFLIPLISISLMVGLIIFFT